MDHVALIAALSKSQAWNKVWLKQIFRNSYSCWWGNKNKLKGKESGSFLKYNFLPDMREYRVVCLAITETDIWVLTF